MQLYGKILRHIKILFCMKDVHHLKPLALFFYIAKFLYKSVDKLKIRPFFSKKKEGNLTQKNVFFKMIGSTTTLKSLFLIWSIFLFSKISRQYGK